MIDTEVRDLDSQTVYVIDDEAGVREALARLFRSAGLSVSAFESPMAFLEVFDPEMSGCLVLDLEMPECRGTELQQKLNEVGSFLPIIFLTGRAEVPDGIRAMKQGALDFHTKPVEEDVLLASVREALCRETEARLERVEFDELSERLATLTPREHEVLKHGAGLVAGRAVERYRLLLSRDAADFVFRGIQVRRARCAFRYSRLWPAPRCWPLVSSPWSSIPTTRRPWPRSRPSWSRPWRGPATWTPTAFWRPPRGKAS